MSWLPGFVCGFVGFVFVLMGSRLVWLCVLVLVVVVVVGFVGLFLFECWFACFHSFVALWANCLRPPRRARASPLPLFFFFIVDTAVTF